MKYQKDYFKRSYHMFFIFIVCMSNNSYKDTELIELRDKILNLEENQYLEIYNIFNHHDIKYTKNKNGIFVKMDLITNECLNDIEKLLIYYEDLKINN